MARLFRARSKRFRTRSRLATSIFCRMIGCSAENMKKSHRMSPMLMSRPLLEFMIHGAYSACHSRG